MNKKGAQLVDSAYGSLHEKRGGLSALSVHNDRKMPQEGHVAGRGPHNSTPYIIPHRSVMVSGQLATSSISKLPSSGHNSLAALTLPRAAQKARLIDPLTQYNSSPYNQKRHTDF